MSSEFDVSPQPNPATGLINLAGLNGQARMQLLDVDGNIVFSSDVLKDEHLDIGHLPGGSYKYLIYGEQGSSTGLLEKS